MIEPNESVLKVKSPELNIFEKPKKDIEKDRQRILSSVSEYTSKNIRSRIALILNNFPHTRDSDIDLQIKYWEIFQPDLLDGKTIRVENYHKLEHLRTISRERAFIQNTCGLFQACTAVREKRGVLADEEKAKIKKDKPDFPVMTIYADESGKNDKFLIVGSIWFLDEMSSNELIQDIFTWRNSNGIKNEFHFRSINDRNIDTYKHFVKLLIAKSSAIGLRAITVERTGISNTLDAFIRLYSQLLLKGIQYEQDSGRAILPRYVQFVKDKEEEGFDKLLLTEVEDRLKSASQSHYNNTLFIDFLKAEDSASHPFLQVADLFASSINRIYNQPSVTISAKDNFASYFLDAFGISMKLSKTFTESDMSFHIAL